MIDFSKVITKEMKVEEAYRSSIPQTISFAQGKRAMIRRGYWQVANDFVDAIEDETERLLAQSALHDPQEFHRTSPFLNYLAGVLEIPDSEIDEMFIEGAADII